MENLRHVPPHSPDAERSVLGAVLASAEHLDEISQSIQADDFYVRNHQRIFAAMMEMSAVGEKIDLVTLSDRLKTKGELTEIGGSSFLADLQDSFLSSAFLNAHVRIIHSKARLRSLIAAGTSIVTRCYNEQEQEIEALLDSAQKTISDAINSQNQQTISPISELVMDVLRTFDAKDEVGIKAGFVDLDYMTGGFKPGQLIVLAARPGVGKSALAANFAEAIAIENRPVGIFSLEMSKQEIVTRMISARSRVPLQKINKKRLEDREHSRFAHTVGEVSSWPIFIDETSAHTIGELLAKARIMRRIHKVELLIVDYLQLMQSNEHHDNRVLEIGDITRRLKLLAREIQVPIVLLSQLNRQSEQRSDKRPMLSDLRESGNIEQDADIVMFLYRESIHVKTDENANIAELIIAKQRNGPTGTIPLVWHGEITRFQNGMRSGEY